MYEPDQINPNANVLSSIHLNNGQKILRLTHVYKEKMKKK